MKLDSEKVFTPVQFTLESQEEYDAMLSSMHALKRVFPSESRAKLLNEMINCLQSGGHYAP